MEDELLWLVRYLSGLIRLLAVLGLYGLLMNELLWRTADPESHCKLLWLVQYLQSVEDEPPWRPRGPRFHGGRAAPSRSEELWAAQAMVALPSKCADRPATRCVLVLRLREE